MIQIKRGKASDFSTQEVILHAGQPGFEKDTKRLKIGDGVTDWDSLEYIKAFDLDKTYPIGSVYMNTTEVNPNELFGGSWKLLGTTTVSEINIYYFERISGPEIVE
jgi:hypothetical protein